MTEIYENSLYILSKGRFYDKCNIYSDGKHNDMRNNSNYHMQKYYFALRKSYIILIFY